MEYYYQILEQVTAATDSSLILFFIIVAAMVLPLYFLIIKDRKYAREHENRKREHDNEKHDKYIEREREIIRVIQEISSVIAENTAVTKGFGSLLDTTARMTNDSFERMYNRLDIIGSDTAETNANVKVILSTVSGNKPGEGLQ